MGYGSQLRAAGTVLAIAAAALAVNAGTAPPADAGTYTDCRVGYQHRDGQLVRGALCHYQCAMTDHASPYGCRSGLYWAPGYPHWTQRR